MMPSDLSDFNLYGGIYRYLNLVYVPALSIDKLFAHADVDSAGKNGKLNIRARFHNPALQKNALVRLSVFDPYNKQVQSADVNLSDLNGDVSLKQFNIKSPQLWSTDQPLLYTIEAKLLGSEESVFKEKIGFRQFEFVKKGP